tara:strand:- start:4173 stop:5624 length:1452 start_codon:yes stop_codon:yes gene_type:complete
VAKKTSDKTDKAEIASTGTGTGAPEAAASGDDLPHTGASEVDAVPDADADAPAQTGKVVLRAPLHDPRDGTSLTPAAALAPPEHDPRAADEYDGDAATLGAEADGDIPSEDAAPESAAVSASSIPSTKPAPTTAPDPARDAAKNTASGAAQNGAPVAERVIVKRGGFFPALLGGVIAAGLGFGLALALYPEGAPFMSGGGRDDGLSARIDEQASAIEDLRARVDAGPDLSALEGMSGDVAEVKSGLSELSSATDQNTASLSNLAARLTEIEKRPVETGVSQEAIQAYEGELSKLQQAMQDQRAEIEDMIAQSEEMKADAASTARDTQIRAALVRIGSALDAGDPYETPLSALADMGLEIPAPLQDHASAGVVTMARLRDDFPEYARKALAVTRDSGDTSSVVSFLKTQLGARSLNPRDGDDPDAILSRAEGKLRDGQLRAALDELSSLPDAAKAEMQPWIDPASGRAEAVAAQEAMSADFKTN